MTKYAVKPPAGMCLFRATISLLLVAAWFVASNHCALGGMLPKAEKAPAAHSHCHSSEDAPADEEKRGDCDGSKCCKSLSAPSLALAKSVMGHDSGAFAAAGYPQTAELSLGAQHDSAPSKLDTGPPGETSFAELVLQRSILAHAPPVFA